MANISATPQRQTAVCDYFSSTSDTLVSLCMIKLSWICCPCLIHKGYGPILPWKAAPAHFSSKPILPFGFTGQCTNTWEIEPMTPKGKQMQLQVLWAHIASLIFQQTRYIDPVLDQCWASVVDGGPTLIQTWVNGLCFHETTSANDGKGLLKVMWDLLSRAEPI